MSTPPDPASAEPVRPVKRRRVFYLSGFDPHGARRYLTLYREQGPKQAAISGYELSVERGGWSEDKTVFDWSATWRRGDEASSARIDFLSWDDIARRRMKISMWRLYMMTIAIQWRYWGTGAGQGMWRLRFAPIIAGLYPLISVLLYLLVSLGVAVLAWVAAARLTGWPGWTVAPVGALVFWQAMRLARRVDARIFAIYVMCCLGLTRANAEGQEPELDARLDIHADTIAAACASGEADEVLVIGHSVGAQLAIAVTARAIERGAGQGDTTLSLMTIGEVAPMTTFLPRARKARAELALLARTKHAYWLDVTAATDGVCFALSDPPAVAGVAAPPGERTNPKIISAAFRRTQSKETFEGQKWKFHRIHFQYLRAFEHPAEYDYFAITAGPMTLEDRFRDRPSSPNVIDRVCAPPLEGA